MPKIPRVPIWLILLLLIGAGLIFTEAKTRRFRVEDELNRMADRTETLAQDIATLVSHTCRQLGAISRNQALITPDATREERLAAMRQVGQAYQFMTELSLFDSNGYVIATTCFLPVSQDCTTWFEAAKAGRFTISRPVVAADGNQLNYAVYMPVAPDAKSDVAVIRATVPFAHLCRMVCSYGERIGGNFVMTDGFGNVLAGCDIAQAQAPFSVRFPLAAMGEQGLWKFDSGAYNFVSRPVVPEGLLPGEAMRLLWLKPKA